MLRFRLILAASLCAATAQAAEKARNMKLDPVVAYFKLPPGGYAKQVFNIGNDSEQTLHLKISRRDAWHTDDGARTFPEAGSTPQGLGNWLTLPPVTKLRIAPGAKASFEGVVTVPPGAPPRTYLGGYAVQIDESARDEGGEAPPQSIEAGARMIAGVMLLIHVDVRPEGAPPPKADVEIADQRIESPQGGKPLSVKLRLLNRSVYEVKPVGTLAIFDRSGKIVGKAAFSPVALWPGQALWFEAVFAERLPPGKYNGLAAFGLQEPSGSGEAYEAPPLQRKVDFEVGQPALKPPERAAPTPVPEPTVRSGHKKHGA